MTHRRRTTRLRVRVLRTARHGPHLTAKQIAATVGCHPSTVTKHLRTHNRVPPTSRSERRDTAASSCTTPATLMTLSRTDDTETRNQAASNPRCPPATLTRLANDPNRDVRWQASSNANCPPAALARFAADPDGHARRSAAGNPNCPPPTLARLAADTDPPGTQAEVPGTAANSSKRFQNPGKRFHLSGNRFQTAGQQPPTLTARRRHRRDTPDGHTRNRCHPITEQHASASGCCVSPVTVRISAPDRSPPQSAAIRRPSTNIYAPATRSLRRGAAPARMGSPDVG